MKTLAQIKSNKEYLAVTIDNARQRAKSSGDPLDKGIAIGLENAHILIYDEVYGVK